eukprot:Amastigsp_a177630_6.p5 type:complete len:108 gc:universal Amastigsp_a177630_6:1325-1002(-)
MHSREPGGAYLFDGQGLHGSGSESEKVPAGQMQGTPARASSGLGALEFRTAPPLHSQALSDDEPLGARVLKGHALHTTAFCDDEYVSVEQGTHGDETDGRNVPGLQS